MFLTDHSERYARLDAMTNDAAASLRGCSSFEQDVRRLLPLSPGESVAEREMKILQILLTHENEVA